MSETFDNRIGEFGPGSTADELIPVIQWNHEEGAFEIPVSNLPPGLELPFERAEVVHTGGTEESWLARRLDLAVIGLRERLEQRLGSTTVVVPAGAGRVGENGVYTRKQVLAVCRQLAEAGFLELVILTVKSTTSADLGAALRAGAQFRQAANWAASERKGERMTFPRWAFYLPLEAGNTERTPQGGKVTPLHALLPEGPTREDFGRLMIAPDVRAFVESCLERAQAWERDPQFYAGGQMLGGSNYSDRDRPTRSEPAGETAPAPQASRPTRSRKAPAGQGGNGDGSSERTASSSSKAKTDGAPNDALRVPAPIGTKRRPDYQGQALGDLLQEREGRRLVRYLATRFQPKSTAALQAVKAAKALVTAGLAG